MQPISLRPGLARFVGVLIALYACSALSQDPPALVAELSQQYKLPPQAFAVQIQELDSGRIVYQWNTQQPMNPASLMKLVTTYAALEKLGPTFTWKTSLAALAPPAESAGPKRAAKNRSVGIWQGDWILKGSGDPSLNLERLWLLLRQARQLGWREIDGNLWLDRQAFQLPPHDPAAFDGEPSRPYNVGADALLLNYQSVQIRFVPDPFNKRLRILTDPDVPVQDDIKPSNSPCPGSSWRDGVSAVWQGGMTLKLSGTYPLACGAQSLFRSPPQADAYATVLIRQLWQELGGVWHGQAKTLPRAEVGRQDVTPQIIAQIESPPLAEIVREINKNSNNVMARNLFLTLGLDDPAQPSQPSTLERSRQAVREILQTKGLQFTEFSVENGAGLSRTDRLSAASLSRLLQTAWRSPVMPEFVSSLAVLAQDGTIRSRLKNKGMNGVAHLKTGTLNDVRALAGYLLASSGKRYSYVCLLQDPRADEIGRALQDSVLQWAYSNF
ncbi:D-alanyl-D-alanine carboxypeptidase/D-alanyl-D-alanine-endopeptidase [Parvibium lacunae]|uniref:D-alanyl-D-alanine carboxypeptidase/D-alanyl-D-alanine-endopeptidase n=1 Tax=Parvibium lacunae TaxID=1888893 RepID=A0A368L1S3_9BURK|nr:D-alanyl-D-alanine carboxypeptidase/D-alanyl-D-alanine-endopeptidase [Parvibium lacunae]RCS57514.1 D-alanyl-D-alanine carboxypeptidase/D-alanyl-D-alanine-endopeptidase [Parvibium lacunae]